VASITVQGTPRAKAGVTYPFIAQPMLADGTPVTRPVTWSIVSGPATIDQSGRLTTNAAGSVVLKAASGSASITAPVTSIDWLAFGTAANIGTALVSDNVITNQFNQSEYPTLLVGCGTGTFVIGVITQSFITQNGLVAYSFDSGSPISDTWLEVQPNFNSLEYIGGSNGARKTFAGRVAASQQFLFAFTEFQAGAHAMSFSVTGMTAAIAPSIAACPSNALRATGPSADSTTVVGLLAAWVHRK
jgi:hypothetical protein